MLSQRAAGIDGKVAVAGADSRAQGAMLGRSNTVTGEVVNQSGMMFWEADDVRVREQNCNVCKMGLT